MLTLSGSPLISSSWDFQSAAQTVPGLDLAGSSPPLGSLVASLDLGDHGREQFMLDVIAQSSYHDAPQFFLSAGRFLSNFLYPCNIIIDGFE